MTLIEYENDGTQWVPVGQWNDIDSQEEADWLVEKFQDGSRRFVLMQSVQSPVVKEYLPQE